MKNTFYSFLLLLLIGCDSNPTLQKYMAKNSKNPNFIAVDFGANLLQINQNELSENENEALESFKKLNILAFRKKENNGELYTQEKTEIQCILKENPQYEELFRIGKGSQKVTIYSVGKSELFDELVLFADSQEHGFVIMRILGKDINPANLMDFVSLIEKSNLDNNEQLNTLFKTFGQGV